MKDESVTISKERYEELLEAERTLKASETQNSVANNLDSPGIQEMEGAGEWGGYIDEYSNAGYGR